jgi:hypothetical protein
MHLLVYQGLFQSVTLPENQADFLYERSVIYSQMCFCISGILVYSEQVWTLTYIYIYIYRRYILRKI